MTEGMTWTDRSLSVGAKRYEAPHPPLPQPGRVREISADVHVKGVLLERGHVRHVHAFYLLHSRLSFGLSFLLCYRSSPQRLLALQEIPKLLLVRQTFVVPQGRHAHRAHRVGEAQALLRSPFPQVTGEVPRVKGIARSDGVHFGDVEVGLFEDAVLEKEQAPVSSAFEHHLLRPLLHQLLDKILIVPLPECPSLLVADEEQIHLGQQFLHETLRALRRPELRAVVDVEAHSYSGPAGLSGRPRGKGAAFVRERGGDAGQVQKMRPLEIVGVDGIGSHCRGGGAPAVVVDLASCGEPLAQIQPGRILLQPAHPRDVYPFSPDTVQNELARFVFSQTTHPSGGDTEAGESDSQIGFGPANLQFQTSGVPEATRLSRGPENHRLAGRDHFYCRSHTEPSFTPREGAASRGRYR